MEVFKIYDEDEEHPSSGASNSPLAVSPNENCSTDLVVKRERMIRWKTDCIEDLDLDTRERLGSLLDPECVIMKNWQHLASSLIHYSSTEIENLKRQLSPTIDIISIYEERCEAPSIPHLYRAIQKIQRFDALKLFDVFMENEDEDKHVEEEAEVEIEEEVELEPPNKSAKLAIPHGLGSLKIYNCPSFDNNKQAPLK